ncbi:MAG: DUF4388 domain-containing protein [Chloroflexi bacterium]|nr:DUF4388 domain-containing protein [Chloroflexota bacterium]
MDDRHLDSSIGMRGRLDVVSPFELGQFLLLGRKTGALHLIRGEERGVLYVLEGRIVSAVGPDLRGGPDTAMKLIQWTEGEFHFIPESVAPSDEIPMGTENLLLETARLMDESGLGEKEVAASLEQVDELSRTFAAISATSIVESSGHGGSPSRWVAKVAGRSLLHVAGHALVGVAPDGAITAFDTRDVPDPGRVLGQSIDGPPVDEWMQRKGPRLYLSWGSEGFRLVHPFPSPAVERHLRDASAVEQMLGASAAVAIYGPSGVGKSLLTALLVSAQAAQGYRVLYLSGVPTHDLGDGSRIHHVVVAPGSSLMKVREALERWHPDSVAVDLEPSEEMAAFARSCRAGGIPLVLTLRAPERESARESVRVLYGDTRGWQFLSPSPAGAGPVLEVLQEAA